VGPDRECVRSRGRSALHRRRQLRLGSVADGQPLSGAAGSLRSGNRAAERERNLDQHQETSHPPPASAPKQRLKPSASKRASAKNSPANGLAKPRRRHLFLSAGGSGHRRVRPLPQVQSQSDSFEERVRVEPFTTSILDGIDIRETIRNWPPENCSCARPTVSRARSAPSWSSSMRIARTITNT